MAGGLVGHFPQAPGVNVPIRETIDGGPITLIDPALYAREEPGDEPELVGAGAGATAGAALTDHDAKRPGKAANFREKPAPKPPLGKTRKPRPR